MKHILVSTIILLFMSSIALAVCVNTITESTPSSRFVLNGDETITDSETGLMWMRCSIGQTWDGAACTGTALTMNWKQALDMAVGANFANAGNWRLPNIKELKSITEDRCYSPAINESIFPDTPSTSFWSSTSGTGGDFSYSADHSYVKDAAICVRLVREAP